MSALYELTVHQKIPSTVDDVWNFISTPSNLNTITPPEMRFNILTDLGDGKMYQGMIIQYKVSPLMGINMNWVTEITHVSEKQFFVDEQRFGPYNFWHHQHHIKAIENGVLMTDILHYRLPLGPVGRIVHAIDIKKRLNKIFDYRYKKIEEIFGKFQE